MGAGASSLPDSLSDEQIRALTAESFQETLHKTLQDPDGTVPKDLFVNCFEQGVEREVFQLFMSYAPDGMMSKSVFLSLCRVNKLLHKHMCTSSMAGDIFDKALRPMKRGEDESPRLAETIGYNQFRTLVVPEFAKLKKTEENVLIERLSRCEFPSSVVLAGSELTHSEKDTTSLPPVVSTDIIPPTTENTDSTAMAEPVPEAASKEKNLQRNISTDIVGALTKLQTLSRRKIAKRKVEQLKEVRDIETGKAPRSRRPTIEPEPTKRRSSRESDRIKSLMAEQAAVKKEIKELMGQVSEETDADRAAFIEEEPPKELTPAEIAEHSLNDLFDIYCNPPGEMEVNAFKKFLRETYTLTKKFTVNDADTVFKKAIAKASTAPQTSHMRKGVFYGKRLNFYVFYHSVIPLTAKQRGGISTQQLIEFLNNANVAARARDMKKQQDHLSRRPSKDLSAAAQRERRPSRDLPPARLSSKDGDPNPFARRRPSGEKLGEGKGIASGPRKSFDKGVMRNSFDKGPSKSASEAGLPKAS